MSAVTFINAFEVPAGDDEKFFALWSEVNAYMRRQPGYVSHQLHRSLSSDARYRYVNVVQWESETHWKDAHGAGFRAIVTRPGQAVFTTLPCLYEVVDNGRDLDILGNDDSTGDDGARGSASDGRAA